MVIHEEELAREARARASCILAFNERLVREAKSVSPALSVGVSKKNAFF